jgi:hypothetical protein
LTRKGRGGRRWEERERKRKTEEKGGNEGKRGAKGRERERI